MTKMQVLAATIATVAIGIGAGNAQANEEPSSEIAIQGTSVGTFEERENARRAGVDIATAEGRDKALGRLNDRLRAITERDRTDSGPQM